MHLLAPFLLFLACACSATAAPTLPTDTVPRQHTAHLSIDSIFYSVPLSELPLLASNPRLDMLDRYNSGMKAFGENIFQRNSVMEEKSDRYIRVKLTAASQWELTLLPDSSRNDGDHVYACTHTLLPPVSQSRINFYDTRWQRIDSLSLPSVGFDDFLPAADTLLTARIEELRRSLPSPIIYMEWTETSTAQPTLQLRVATDDLGMEAQEEAQRLLQPIRLRWNGRRFVRQ